MLESFKEITEILIDIFFHFRLSVSVRKILKYMSSQTFIPVQYSQMTRIIFLSVVLEALYPSTK